MCRYREQVLREAVVDLPCHACALLGDGPPELGVADRPPDADEQHRVREEAQEVARRDVAVGDERREDVVQVSEERERRAEGEPAVEIVPARAIAEAEPDNGDEAQESADGERCAQQPRLVVVGGGEDRQRVAEERAHAPDQRQRHGHEDQQLGECPPFRRHPPAREGGARDQAAGEDTAPDPRPLLRPV